MRCVDAVGMDRLGLVQVAASLYEAGLDAGDYDAEDLVNLLALYWQARDYGFWTHQGLPRDFVVRAGTRLHELLARAPRLYPRDPAAWFWTMYIPWAMGCTDALDVAGCLRSLREHPDYLEPVLVAFRHGRGDEYLGQVRAQLARSREEGTTRAGYVASVLESILVRYQWEREQARR